MGFGPGRHEGGPQGHGVEKLLQPHPQTLEREDRSSRGGEETCGDMLETFAAMAARARLPSRLKEPVVSRTDTVACGPEMGTGGKRFRRQ